eukprot:TRINITY_DN7021_c0_g1_i1.p2 TRINITY_DN7021_c0_g1~~TRINITY_DN7021_c0_g1_i1.p2  ORF type:complete len:518 (+),score=134.82 TRINITY_DN7021_c0_g1_i1:268-1821(+)
MSHNDERVDIIKEIIKTEKSYVIELRILVNEFVIPTKDRNLLSEEDFRKLFANVGDLLEVNESLLKDIDRFPPEEINLGEVFVSKAPLFKRYAIFCSKQSGGPSKLQEYIKKSPNFGSFVRDKERLPICRNQLLQDFLITPMQRMTRYPLLLKKLLDKTSEDHPDYLHLETALNGVNKICDIANETAFTAFMLDKIQYVSNSFCEQDREKINLEGGDRTFLLEGKCNVKKKGKELEVILFLFEDMLLIAQSKGESNVLYKRIDIPNKRVTLLPEKVKPSYANELVFVKDSPSLQNNGEDNSLELLTLRVRLETLYFASSEIKRKWAKELGKATDMSSKKTMRGNRRSINSVNFSLDLKRPARISRKIVVPNGFSGSQQRSKLFPNKSVSDLNPNQNNPNGEAKSYSKPLPIIPPTRELNTPQAVSPMRSQLPPPPRSTDNRFIQPPIKTKEEEHTQCKRNLEVEKEKRIKAEKELEERILIESKLRLEIAELKKQLESSQSKKFFSLRKLSMKSLDT